MKNYDRSPEMGKLLRQKRKSISLTIREVAASAEISASHLSRIEQGDRFPSASVLRRLAEPLGFEETELMMQAGYLSPVKSSGSGAQSKKLDPYVANVLSNEPLEIQRAVIPILTIIKRVITAQTRIENS
ncbi:MAG: helix-turn-helix domain-containing protein [Dehalococcoidales bacterium]|nr:helix-turn-helix domain-containing protein [Dehalococcoidales bacterium]